MENERLRQLGEVQFQLEISNLTTNDKQGGIYQSKSTFHVVLSFV